MSVFVYTFCFNEIQILPIVVQYWRRFASKVIVYDNGSTDGSQEFLLKIPFVELRHYDTQNQLDDYKLQQLKNSIWKESRDLADFAVVCDMDECIWARDLNHELQMLKLRKVVAVSPLMCNLISHDFPRQLVDGQKLAHEVIDQYYDDFWPEDDGPGNGLKRKMLIFDPKRTKETNYKVGCYESSPELEDGFSAEESSRILCMHLHDIGLSRKVKRYAERKSRISFLNVRDHLSDFYLEPPSLTVKDFEKDLKRSKSVRDLIQRSYD